MSRKSISAKAGVKRNSGTITPEGNKDNTSVSKISCTRRLLKVIGKTIQAALAVWGVVLSTWVVFNPRVFVCPAVALDPNNPAFTPFVVHNQGYLAIHDVKFSCSMKYLKLPGNILVVGLGDYTNRFSNPKHVANVIAPGEQYSELLPLTGMEHNKIENADIAIVLTFKPVKWLSWQRETLHRFVATQGKDGQWHWLPQPINK
jgi:hypothetical protein